MTQRALLDTTVFMHAAGAEHPLRDGSLAVLDIVATYPEAFMTDAEVFQEMIHRYRSIRRWNTVASTFHEHMTLMAGRIEPMYPADVEHAAILLDSYPRLSARDLIHVAVAVRVGAPYIVTADASFDDVREVERLDPTRVEEWRERVLAS